MKKEALLILLILTTASAVTLNACGKSTTAATTGKVSLTVKKI